MVILGQIHPRMEQRDEVLGEPNCEFYRRPYTTMRELIPHNIATYWSLVFLALQERPFVYEIQRLKYGVRHQDYRPEAPS